MPTKRETRKIAALDFEPWAADTIAKMKRDFSADTWSLAPDCPIAVDLRIAAVIMGKTKAELIEAARGLKTGVFTMVEHLDKSADALSGLADILRVCLGQTSNRSRNSRHGVLGRRQQLALSPCGGKGLIHDR